MAWTSIAPLLAAEQVAAIWARSPAAGGPAFGRNGAFRIEARYDENALKNEDVEVLVAAGYTAGQAYGLTGYFAGQPRSDGPV